MRVIIDIETCHLIDALTVLETEGFVWDEATGALPLFPPTPTDVSRVAGELPEDKIEAARIVAGVLKVERTDSVRQPGGRIPGQPSHQAVPGWRQRLAKDLFQAIREAW